MKHHPLKWTERDPVENAFWAFCALSAEQKQQMVARYNEMESKRAHPDKLTWEPGE